MKIVVGGQVNKKEIAEKLQEMYGEQVEVAIMDDIQAANAIKSGQADYYLGACHTGGGGALGMAMALLGSSKCATISMPGKPPREESINKAVEEGKVAFGFTADHTDKAIRLLMSRLLENERD